MIKTYMIDGAKGGLGKTLLCHVLVDFYMHPETNGLQEQEYPLLLFDADLTNKDFSTYPIRLPSGKLVPCYAIDLSIIEGWQFIERKVNRYLKNNQSARAIIHCPSHSFWLMEQGRYDEIGAIMRRINTLTLWLMNKSPLCILQLQSRQRLLPNNYQQGVILLNLYFGRTADFYYWHHSQFKEDHIHQEGWVEHVIPCLTPQLSDTLSGIPVNLWFELGIQDMNLSFGYHLSLNTFRYQIHKTLLAIDSIPSL
ncbi:MAG TPA: hypothetical protein PL140_01000 [Ferrovaceae bacterium]|nr:hypothetical protein [Ferrovaceae bacterium]HQU05808.1 hypothetical protein [Ferrovaceae bacterium]